MNNLRVDDAGARDLTFPLCSEGLLDLRQREGVRDYEGVEPDQLKAYELEA